MPDNYKWISYKDRLNLKPKREPKIDKQISQIVGKKIFANDQRLVNLVLRWKKNKDPNNFDNFLHDPEKRKELKEALS